MKCCTPVFTESFTPYRSSLRGIMGRWTTIRRIRSGRRMYRTNSWASWSCRSWSVRRCTIPCSTWRLDWGWRIVRPLRGRSSWVDASTWRCTWLTWGIWRHRSRGCCWWSRCRWRCHRISRRWWTLVLFSNDLIIVYHNIHNHIVIKLKILSQRIMMLKLVT